MNNNNNNNKYTEMATTTNIESVIVRERGRERNVNIRFNAPRDRL